jgi:transcription elongation GreA/GreB family factor
MSAETQHEATVVRPGSRVHYRDNDGKARVVLIRSEESESWPADSLSANSPIGAALMGGRVGQEIEVILHASIPVHRVKIEAIE